MAVTEMPPVLTEIFKQMSKESENMDYRKTYKTSSKVAIGKIKELEIECARLASKCGVNYSENALELANEKIKELERIVFVEESTVKALNVVVLGLKDKIKQKNETIIHLAQVQMEMEKDK